MKMRDILNVLNEDEPSDDKVRDEAETAYEAVKNYLTKHAAYLDDALQPVRQGDFCIRGSKVGLARSLIIVFTHTGHSGIGTAGGNDVILVNCLRGPGDTKYLDTRFGSGGHDTFVHEYAHYLSKGREYANSVNDYNERGETAYYNNSEEVQANYVESTAGFRRLVRSIIEYASPEILQEYKDMTDQQLYEFMVRSCVKKDFINNLEPEVRRRFDKRSMRFISQTIRPLLIGAPSDV
jgi:hypothetical protein